MEAMPPEIPVVPHAEPLHHHNDVSKRILISLIASSCFLASILILLLFFWLHRLRKSRKSPKSPLPPSSRKIPLASTDYSRIAAATNDFHRGNLVEEDDYQALYNACFSEKHYATVKIMRGEEKNIEGRFRNEVAWLTKLRHKNIVSLESFCVNGGTRVLVYEPMGNGSLAGKLNGGCSLSWHVRITIAVEVARALEFLHEHATPLVHRNLNSRNILLDSNFFAKISDFGCATQITPSESSDKSDVYAYGVVLLELLTGRASSELPEIVQWATPHLNDRSKLSAIVDPTIRSTMEMKHLYQVAAVAVLCVQKEPSYRPLITDVLHSLIPLVVEPNPSVGFQ